MHDASPGNGRDEIRSAYVVTLAPFTLSPVSPRSFRLFDAAWKRLKINQCSSSHLSASFPTCENLVKLSTVVRSVGLKNFLYPHLHL